MKVLMIGGTGNISSAVARRAVAAGMDVSILTRGKTTDREPVPGVRSIVADAHDVHATIAALGNESFDCVVDWIAFTADDIERDLALFRDRTGQFVFISSASAYQTPPATLPVRESTPLKNRYWEYSQNKIAAEDRLIRAYRDEDFPATIVRPSHTYDQTMVPFDGGWTVMQRMRDGREVVIPGDGTSLWTMTHSDDFAVGFTGLIGRAEAIGETFHITAESAMTWNFIYQTMAEALGVDGRFVRVASETIQRTDPVWGAALLGDKSNSMIFDNAKIRGLVPDFQISIPFEVGARQIVDWFDADDSRKTVDASFDHTMDLLVAAYRPRNLLAPQGD